MVLASEQHARAVVTYLRSKIAGTTGREVDPGFGTGRLIGRSAVPLLDGADDDEENTTKD